jgi:hypothetical protein
MLKCESKTNFKTYKVNFKEGLIANNYVNKYNKKKQKDLLKL